jgi:hypothetical protein
MGLLGGQYTANKVKVTSDSKGDGSRHKIVGGCALQRMVGEGVSINNI